MKTSFCAAAAVGLVAAGIDTPAVKATTTVTTAQVRTVALRCDNGRTFVRQVLKRVSMYKYNAGLVAL